MGLFFGPLGKHFFWSHGHLFWTPRQNFFGVMGLFLGPLDNFCLESWASFFGPLGNFLLESWFPDFQTPPPADEFSDPNLTPLPTNPGIKYVARALAAIFKTQLPSSYPFLAEGLALAFDRMPPRPGTL